MYIWICLHIHIHVHMDTHVHTHVDMMARLKYEFYILVVSGGIYAVNRGSLQADLKGGSGGERGLHEVISSCIK